jgi:hypothetical protein
MSGLVLEPVGDDAVPASVPSAPPTSRRLAERYCPWCRSTHGFGYCAHASWLTQDALARRGARFNWR